MQMEAVDISTSIGDITFTTCLWNASGPKCTTVGELEDLRDCSHSGALVTKTCTPLSRKGNEFPRVYSANSANSANPENPENPENLRNYKGGHSISVNSVGLANLGIDTYLCWIRKQKLSKHPKPIFLSIGGLSMAENKEMLDKISFSPYKPDFIELNVSCPNIEGCDIVGYDFTLLKQYLNFLTFNINKMRETNIIKCGIKLPPYFRETDFDTVGEILNMFAGEIDYVNTINGVPGGLILDTEMEDSVIKPKSGFGGLGGTITKPIGLANVAQLRKRLDKKIDIIGCGGVQFGKDVFEYILCGAQAVEIATQILIEGLDCFERINNELKVLMKRKGYHSLEDFRGNFITHLDKPPT